jgi:hypothetical protein
MLFKFCFGVILKGIVYEEVGMYVLKVLTWHLPGGIKRNHKPQSEL